MVTVFINNKKLFLAMESERVLFARYKTRIFFTGKKSLQEMILELNDNPALKSAVVYADDFDEMWSSFESLYTIIEAAGGLVLNDKNELLMIFRRGCWDLPKGKIEKGESIEEAAIREVEEECGVSKLKIKKQAYTTYHTYLLEDVPVLKTTFWFLMNCNGHEKLKPQTDEGITQAVWADKVMIKENLKNSYSSIKLLIEEVKI